ncbi:TMEM165/GDT1 family protein [Synechococcales cyanobacterium C]|uniref:GDT1 family protein n=1 Tax=Petrachloros mirabilis ULC683 TaxID=2781853 RepID=A0A8K2A7U0_9CYAN|nr:TMEM165/GDT1 family protein [Petrachloros mirabilis]NCJ06305.1 TMEM165/GDT1 family protein [Petrachloros mirabilis ULC683]
MDWNLLSLSFIVVFLAELGDKSQLVAISLSGNCQHPRAIFLGAATALILASFLGVLLGDGIGHLLPVPMLKCLAAIGFAGMGLRLLWPAPEGDLGG